MKQTVNFNQFVDAFNNAGRQAQFSYEALQAIFGYIEDYEQDSGEEIELDVVGLCCDWSEETPQEIVDNYNIDKAELDAEAPMIDTVTYWLQDRTVAMPLDNGNIVYVNF